MTKRTTRKGKSGVGYRRPPVHTRFKPGQSGNPRGRPKGARSADAIIKAVIGRKVTLHEGGVGRKVDLLEAVVLRLAQDALKGNPKTAALLIKLAQGFSDSEDTTDPQVLSSQDQKLLDNFLTRAMQKQGGKT